MGYFETVEHVITKADVVLLIVDARLPELAKNKELESLVTRRGKKLLIVFNKIDLVNVSDLAKLRKNFSNAFFVSGSKNIAISKLKTGIIIEAKRMRIEFPHVGVIGYPNVGKSAIINALAHGSRTKVSSVAGTTKGVQWVKVGKLRVIDSPGVITYDEDESWLGLIGAKNPEQMHDQEKVACNIINHALKKNKRALEVFYDIELPKEKTMDSYEILLEIGKKRGFLMKKGLVDEKRTSIQIIRDWQKGKLII